MTDTAVESLTGVSTVIIGGGILGAPVRYADSGDFRLERFADGDVFRSSYGGNRV